MPHSDGHASPGFQGSETSSAEITVYTQRGDPLLFRTGRDAVIKMDGRSSRDEHPSLVTVSTSKTMGSASGSWQVTVKPSTIAEQLFNQILDDDWVDIVLRRHGRTWHVMRGLVDDVRSNKTVAGTGATSEVFVLSGRDFAKIWEVTPIWFNLFTDAQRVGAFAYQATFDNVGKQNPAVVVKSMLEGFLKVLGKSGTALWEFPSSVPNQKGTFVASIDFDNFDSGFTNKPPRTALGVNYAMLQGGIWNFAQEWSDPTFCELFTDTLPRGLASASTTACSAFFSREAVLFIFSE